MNESMEWDKEPLQTQIKHRVSSRLVIIIVCYATDASGLGVPTRKTVYTAFLPATSIHTPQSFPSIFYTPAQKENYLLERKNYHGDTRGDQAR